MTSQLAQGFAQTCIKEEVRFFFASIVIRSEVNCALVFALFGRMPCLTTIASGMPFPLFGSIAVGVFAFFAIRKAIDTHRFLIGELGWVVG